MRKVLVTGASGFIGCHSLPCLLNKGYEVHAVSARKSFPISDKRVTWHRADLLDPEKCSQLLEYLRPTHLLHLAWYAEPGKFWSAAENMQWVGATAMLMRAFSERGGQRAVMAGTCAEYDWSYSLLAERTTPCQPRSLYGTCKLATQSILEAWSRQVELSSAWGRLFFLYGPDEHPSRLVRSVINTLQKGQPTRCTHGNQVRDFMHVEDAAAALVALLDSDVSGVLNIASGNPVSLKDLIFSISDKLSRSNLVELGSIPVPMGEPDCLMADISRLRDEVGFVPRFDLDKGISSTIQSMKIASKSDTMLLGMLS